MRIIAFGDSITWGGNDTQGGWADRLKRRLLEQYVAGGNKWQLVNCGVGGDTSRELLKRIDPELQARKRQDEPEPIITIGIGINDSRYIGPDKQEEVSLDDFKQNMSQIIDVAQSYSSKVILVGLTPVKGDELSYKHYTYVAERIQAYEAVLLEYAVQRSLVKVEVYEALRAKGETVLSFDGLHISDAGHALIAELVWTGLSDFLE